MVLPNVNELLPSLSSLQILPPPKDSPSHGEEADTVNCIQSGASINGQRNRCHWTHLDEKRQDSDSCVAQSVDARSKDVAREGMPTTDSVENAFSSHRTPLSSYYTPPKLPKHQLEKIHAELTFQESRGGFKSRSSCKVADENDMNRRHKIEDRRENTGNGCIPVLKIRNSSDTFNDQNNLFVHNKTVNSDGDIHQNHKYKLSSKGPRDTIFNQQSLTNNGSSSASSRHSVITSAVKGRIRQKRSEALDKKCNISRDDGNININSVSKNKTNDDKVASNLSIIPMKYMFDSLKVYPRTLIQPTIHHSAATDLWIVTINTDPNAHSTSPMDYAMGLDNKSNKQLKAFSFYCERSARASAYANAPPFLLPISSTPQCMICNAIFTSILRRPKHCHNCGVVICSNYNCSTFWNRQMFPETYMRGKRGLGPSKVARVCTSCDGLAKRLKHALLNGKYDSAVEVCLTGNLNLRCPFIFKDDKEIMFPIHCAILGRSESLLRWLIDVQYCPIKVLSIANKNKKLTNVETNLLPTLSTSKGRSVLDLAMSTKHVGILRYLVNEKGLSVYEVTDLNLALGALETMIHEFPDVESVDNGIFLTKKKKCKTQVSYLQVHSGQKQNENLFSDKVKSYNHLTTKSCQQKSVRIPSCREYVSKYSFAYSPKHKGLTPRDINRLQGGNTFADSEKYDSEDEQERDECSKFDFDDDASVATTIQEKCIICQDMPINCVATPCGHQVCCVRCSCNLTACPACQSNCHFIELYQP